MPQFIFCLRPLNASSRPWLCDCLRPLIAILYTQFIWYELKWLLIYYFISLKKLWFLNKIILIVYSQNSKHCVSIQISKEKINVQYMILFPWSPIIGRLNSNLFSKCSAPRHIFAYACIYIYTQYIFTAMHRYIHRFKR